MSRYEWERGSFLLPAAAVADFKKALAGTMNRFHDAVRDEAITRHKAINTRSVEKYRTALGKQRSAFYRSLNMSRASEVSEAAFAVLSSIVYSGKIHQPTVADINRVAPRATNRTTTWRLDDCSVSINGRTVDWSVSENKHAVDRAHENPLGRAFFTAMKNITWTRGTGGIAMGNDEYNRDESNSIGGGGNYFTFEYGPLGKTQHGYAYA